MKLFSCPFGPRADTSAVNKAAARVYSTFLKPCAGGISGKTSGNRGPVAPPPTRRWQSWWSYFLIQRCEVGRVCAAVPKDRRKSTYCSSRSSMNSTAMIPVVNTNGGSDAFMSSDLFPEFRGSGKHLKCRSENHRRDHPPPKKRVT
jgi:hypothetical protein